MRSKPRPWLVLVMSVSVRSIASPPTRCSSIPWPRFGLLTRNSLKKLKKPKRLARPTAELASEKDNALGDPSVLSLPGLPSGSASADRPPLPADNSAFNSFDLAPAPLVVLPALEPSSDTSLPPPVRLVSAADVPEEWLPEPTAIPCRWCPRRQKQHDRWHPNSPNLSLW